MTRDDKEIKVCAQGHRYARKSDCPTCPVCEVKRKPENGFFSNLVAPARRALENNGILSLNSLATYTETELLQFHGLGPASIPKLNAALKVKGMSLKHE